MTKKHFLLGLLAVAAVVGQLNAETFSTDLFASNSSFGSNLTPLQAQGPYGGTPDPFMSQVVAGSINTLFGLWSWMHKDIFGGALTAGLEVGGILIMVAVPSVMSSPMELGTLMNIMYAGMAVSVGGMVFGFVRGMTESKKQTAVATGFGGNPLEHVSFNVVPGVGGSLVYSTKL